MQLRISLSIGKSYNNYRLTYVNENRSQGVIKIPHENKFMITPCNLKMSYYMLYSSFQRTKPKEVDMSFSSTRSKTILNWIAKHPHLIEHSMEKDHITPEGKAGPVYWVEYDGWGEVEGLGGYSHWVFLAAGWYGAEPTLHLIHEPTVKEVMYWLNNLSRCDCEQCV